MISKERCEYFRPKPASGVAAEIDILQFPSTAAPTAVVPRAHYKIHLVIFVGFLEGLVKIERAVHIFLVPPSADHKRRHACVGLVKVRRLCLPVRIPGRMPLERSPRVRDLSHLVDQ